MSRTFPVAVCCLLGVAIAAQDPAPAVPAAPAAPRALAPMAIFQLDFLMQYPFEEPKGWLDAQNYLVFDPGKPALDGERSWQSVDAATGKRTVLLARSALAAALAAAEVPAGAIAEAIDDAERQHWDHDHSHLLLNVGGDLFVADRSGKVVRLTNDPADEVGEQFSPDGAMVAFVRDHNLHVVPAAGGEARALTTDGHQDLFYGRLDWVYQEEVYGRGNWQGYWWSPDGKQIALLKLDESPVQEFTLVADAPARPALEVVNYPKAGEPNPKVWLGIVPVGAGGNGDATVRWLDLKDYPDDDRLIVRVTWAPDGRELFFQVQGREQTWLDLLAADAGTGAVRKVFREQSDCWVEPGPEPEFVPGSGDFLWLSERSGNRHIYRCTRDGVLQPVTNGAWDVKEIEAIGGDRIWFTGNMADCKGVHLFKVQHDGIGLAQVTTGGGTHDVDMAPDRGAFLSQWSSATVPNEITVFDAQGQVVRKVAESKTRMLDAFGLQPPQFVQIKARDGFVMEAMVISPRGAELQQPLPTLMHVYAGPHTPKVVDAWGSRDYLWHQMLAQQGIRTVVVDNRSASGKGRIHHKACWRRLGASELQDLEDAARWLAEQKLTDPARLGMWGWSYGGYQTLYNLTHSKLWKCGIAVNAVTDWRNYDTIYTERYLGLPSTNEVGYASSSVVESAGNLHGRLLLMAAAMDDNVHMQNSLQFLKAMQAAGKDCDFMVYPGVRHGIEDFGQQLHLLDKMTRFLRENL